MAKHFLRGYLGKDFGKFGLIVDFGFEIDVTSDMDLANKGLYQTIYYKRRKEIKQAFKGFKEYLDGKTK